MFAYILWGPLHVCARVYLNNIVISFFFEQYSYFLVYYSISCIKLAAIESQYFFLLSKVAQY